MDDDGDALSAATPSGGGTATNLGEGTRAGGDADDAGGVIATAPVGAGGGGGEGTRAGGDADDAGGVITTAPVGAGGGGGER